MILPLDGLKEKNFQFSEMFKAKKSTQIIHYIVLILDVAKKKKVMCRNMRICKKKKQPKKTTQNIYANATSFRQCELNALRHCFAREQ